MALLRDGRDGALPFSRLLAGSAINLVRGAVQTEELRSLAAPWPLHLRAGPENPASALWAMIPLATLPFGNPTPVGGSGRLTDALVGLVTERGGMSTPASTWTRSSCATGARPACGRSACTRSRPPRR